MIPVTVSKEVRNRYRKSDGLNVAWGWAVDNFGNPGHINTKSRWAFDSYNTFYFRDQADAVLFALTWA